MGKDLQQRLDWITKAMGKDGFHPARIEYFEQPGYEKVFGILAEHKTAVNYDTKQPKRMYYLEGTHYQMGYLLGRLAEPETTEISTEFAREIIFSFFAPGLDFDFLSGLGKIVISLVDWFIDKIGVKIPKIYADELDGLIKGCRDENPETKLDVKGLEAINFGFDNLLALIYAFDINLDKLPKEISIPLKAARLKPKHFRVPLMCNGFIVNGKLGRGHTYLGRDMMFSTACVLQNTLAYFIYNPFEKNSDGKDPQMLLSVNSPGFLGTFAAMNEKGIATGTNMAPSSACSPVDAGMPCLMISRYALSYQTTAKDAIQTIIDQPRVMSWCHLLTDPNDKNGYILDVTHYNDVHPFEQEEPDFLKEVPEDMKKKGVIPDADFIKQHKSGDFYKGIMVRTTDFEYPDEYQEYNPGLWDYYNKRHVLQKKKELYPDALQSEGFIDKTYKEKNCPELQYFPPHREKNKDFDLVSNHFVIPEMAFYGMHAWTSTIAASFVDDLQWRYDQLNYLLIEKVEKAGNRIKNHDQLFEILKEIINFLAPSVKLPLYYAENKTPQSGDKTQIAVSGSISLFDSTALKVDSLFGYYCDDWVSVDFSNYIYGPEK